MYKTNLTLYEYIAKKYNSISKFAEVFEIPQDELDAILLKDNIIHLAAIVFKVLHSLNIDGEKFIIDGEIAENVTTTDERENSSDEFLNYYMRLSESEKEEVRAFTDEILHRNEHYMCSKTLICVLKPYFS